MYYNVRKSYSNNDEDLKFGTFLLSGNISKSNFTKKEKGSIEIPNRFTLFGDFFKRPFEHFCSLQEIN